MTGAGAGAGVRVLVALLLGLGLTGLGLTWVEAAHQVALPAAVLAWWQHQWPGSGGWAYLVHASLVVAVPLAALGAAGGAWLRGGLRRWAGRTIPGQGRWPLLVAMLPWLLLFPLATLRWAAETDQPAQALLTLLAGGAVLPGWVALPLGLWWMGRVR